MSKVLPKLRTDIDFLPSPSPEHPGLLLRDPYHYSSAMLVIPPALVPALGFLDGQQTDLDLQADLCRRTGQLVGGGVIENFVRTLQTQGFLETGEFHQMREARHAEFRDAPARAPVHVGSGYPDHPEALRSQFAEYFEFCEKPAANPPAALGLAAPHVSPAGGWRGYATAYSRLAPPLADKTFVLLGTSHYGPPERFGLTRKPFATPLGTLEVDTGIVDRLAERGGEAVLMEDYCHAIEHSIEFQCVFLQYALGSGFRILPILCGPFAESLAMGRLPESNGAVGRFFDVLAELAEQEGSRLSWVLGIDLAHIGRRYGDPFAAEAERGRMTSVREQDLERLGRACAGDSQGFFELLLPEQDRLRWCGYSALYTFLKAVPAARGNLLHYEQWNIDPESVVTFAALEFFRDGVSEPRP
ncbi:MAG: AmmeMemoRadiSam system protein B [Acidobacteria bacterium RIFCSPLOWO2_12_FULL_60_22]|nr:MAG: AmmeMemoRadiSam system protein B [Acidobacteria bacterium RIFCSPLOWO2_12_FULL_60_22]